MPKLNRASVLKTYGIDLPPGKYSIHDEGDHYDIFTVRDDTEGCPLLGKTRTAVGVMHCAEVNAALIEFIRKAEDQGDAVWIEVQ